MDEKRINANDVLSEVGIHCSDVDLVQSGTNITTLLQKSKTETFNDANEKIHIETEVLDSSISYSQKDGKSNFNLTKFNIYKKLVSYHAFFPVLVHGIYVTGDASEQS